MSRHRWNLFALSVLVLGGVAWLLASAPPRTPGTALASGSPAMSTGGTAGYPSLAPTFAMGSPSGVPGLLPAATPGVTPSSPAVPTPAATPAKTAVPTVAAIVPAGPCPVFPASNVWNRDISTLPVAADSATLIASIGLDANLHPDFSATGYGIPINVVGASTPRVAVSFLYDDESDPGPYPIPADPLIEGGSDRHVILWDKADCTLFELFAAVMGGGAWHAGSGAIWDLRSNALRPDGWTSADAAGLPILPGLVRYDEVKAGAIRHALRFTAPQTRTSHIYPARHDAGASGSTSLPPMGTRVRLKSSVDISGFGPQARVLLEALKRYGMILADNGSPWYVTGAQDPHWNDDELHALNQLGGSDFEVVDTSGLH